MLSNQRRQNISPPPGSKAATGVYAIFLFPVLVTIVREKFNWKDSPIVMIGR